MWTGAKHRTGIIGIGLCGMVVLSALGGCKQPSSNKPSATPSPKPTPYPLQVSLTGADSFLFDSKGQRVAEVKAATVAAMSQVQKTPDGKAGELSQGEATLYQKGKPVATFRADRVTADREKRTVTGTGNVIVRALRPDSPAIRADKMTWLHDENKILGSGHVLITREPAMRLPGTRFTADTALQAFEIYNSGEMPGAKNSGNKPTAPL